MKNIINISLLLLTSILFVNHNTLHAQTSNPIYRDAFTADPSPLIHNGTMYVYVGHDEAYNGEASRMTEWLCYSTTDMKTWTNHGGVMKPTDFKWASKDAWAAQVVERGGKFYLFTTVTASGQYSGRCIGVGVSDSPTGPFVDAIGAPLVSDKTTPNGEPWDDIDPTVWIDDDGSAYMFWGNGSCYLAKLKSNLLGLDGAVKTVTPPNYEEGPWIHKHNGLYYLTYAGFVAPNGNEQLCYSTATTINGPWTYRGILTGAGKSSFTIHPSIIEYKGQWYLFYHNVTLTLNGQAGNNSRRSVCVDYLCYNTDGTFKPVTQTTAGVTVASPCPSMNVPIVSITTPTNNAVYELGRAINLQATATITSGTISKVEFYNGTTLLGSDNTSPYSFSWTPQIKGSYTITAVATNGVGNKTTSSAVSIKVNVPQGPYNETWNLIPGTIQAENYDVGGNGSSYSDGSAGNTGGATFRMDEDVDIETCTDAGGGYNIGFATAGEWLEYSVDVQKYGVYDIGFRIAANGDAKTLSLSLDEKSIATNVPIPNTAGWQTWQTVLVKNVTLQPGKKILRLTIGATDYINVNYMNFTLVKEIIQESYNKAPFLIPGKIEAEEYDLGGEGLAFHEANTNGNEGKAPLRNDEVDIEVCTDVNGGFNVGYTLKDEWLEYTVNVANTQDYVLDIRVAKDGNGGLFHIEMDGVDITGSIKVPNTGGWKAWQTITLNNISLTQGIHVLRLVFDSDYTNLNYVEFKEQITTGITNSQNVGVQMYPNPFGKEGFQVINEGIFNYKISDLNGSVLEQGFGENKQLFGANLKQGIYLLFVENAQGVLVRKIVRQ